MEKKNQLHQLLAVEGDRKKKAILIMNETINTFTKKDDHFDGLVKTYTPSEEGGEERPPEIKEIVTTVKEKIDYTKKSVVQALNSQIGKEVTNSSGTVKAELKVGDVSFGELSATALLALEQQLTNIREVYKAIPTLDPTRTWMPDENAAKKGVFVSGEEVKFSTKKEEIPLVLYEATKEHPAQVKLVTKDKQVGKYSTVYKSGKITPARKSELLGRIDKLIDTTKRARAKANEAEIIDVKIGNKIFDYIDKG